MRRVVDTQLAALLLHLQERRVRLAAEALLRLRVPSGDARPADLEQREQVLGDGRERVLLRNHVGILT